MTLPSFDFVHAMGLTFGLSELGISLMKRSKGKAISSDGGSLRLLWTVIIASLTAGIFVAGQFPQFRSHRLNPLAPFGVGVYLFGLFLRWYAILYLGRFFTVNVAIAADHRVIDHGPYRYIRHPSYAGALLAFAGYAICLGNALSLVVILVPITFAFFWRIRIEETALLRGLGESYAGYMRKTKRLIPGIL